MAHITAHDGGAGDCQQEKGNRVGGQQPGGQGQAQRAQSQGSLFCGGVQVNHDQQPGQRQEGPALYSSVEDDQEPVQNPNREVDERFHAGLLDDDDFAQIDQEGSPAAEAAPGVDWCPRGPPGNFQVELARIGDLEIAVQAPDVGVALEPTPSPTQAEIRVVQVGARVVDLEIAALDPFPGFLRE